MNEKYNLPLITTVAVLSSVISGCGDSESSTSSTNATEQRAAENYNVSQYDTEFFGQGMDRNSKRRFSIPNDDKVSNTRPVAEISGAHTYLAGETVVLDGSGSYDEDGDELRYFWRQLNGPMIEPDNRYDDTLTFVAPQVSEPTKFNFSLIVYDGMFADLTGFSLQVSPITDDTAPSITHRYPRPDQTHVPTHTEISVTFNEALSEISVNADSLILDNSGSLVTGNVSYDDVTHSIIFSPTSALDEGTQYTVNLGEGIRDTGGNTVLPEHWAFVTTPGAGSTEDSADDKPDQGNDNTSEGGTDDMPDNGSDNRNDDGTDDNPTDGSTSNTGYNLGSTTQQTIDACMDEADKLMLTLVNNARAQTRSCGTMSYQAAPALAWNCQLENAAYGHSLSMAENDYFSHTGNDGSDPGDRISAAGYDWVTYGENIAAGYRDAESVMDGWLTSAGHCANLMNSSFKDIGVGVAEGSGTYGSYWTQDFAAQ